MNRIIPSEQLQPGDVKPAGQLSQRKDIASAALANALHQMNTYEAYYETMDHCGIETEQNPQADDIIARVRDQIGVALRELRGI